MDARIIGSGMVARQLRCLPGGSSDTIFYAAGVADSTCQDERLYRRDRARLQQTLASASASRCRLVYFSTAGHVYGEAAIPWHEETIPQPVSRYGRHKLECEDLIRNSGCRHLIVRLPNLVGFPQNRKQLVPALVDQAVTGRARLLRHAARDILDIEDALRVLARLLNAAPEGGTYNLASGHCVPVEAIFDAIQTILNTSAAVEQEEGGRAEIISLERLGRLLPRQPIFETTYYVKVLSKYVPRIAAAREAPSRE